MRVDALCRARDAEQELLGLPRARARVRRVAIGSWTCPSGNSVDVTLATSTDGATGIIECGWDSPPPLPPPDALHYETVIRPAILRLVAERTETIGSALVVTVP